MNDISRQDAVTWQQSQERVLHYLKALGLPPVQSLEIVLETMARATAHLAKTSAKQIHPTPVAMRFLRQVLSERNLSLADLPEKQPIDARPNNTVSALVDPCACDEDYRPGMPPEYRRAMPAMPELRRGSMLPQMQQSGSIKNILVSLLNLAVRQNLSRNASENDK
ncbi:hypothetical protein [Desulfosarcina sp.]|uniref:hypothetical protein n=1 Tax=Desulfosarcina sp. TaxID=2027861 RepID=UPI003970D28E